jgi:hydroxyacylglutathione hydrolase
MKIHPIYTHNALRNFTYLIELPDASCLVLDPWDEKQVNQALQQRQLTLSVIINTHEHWDHTQGNQALVDQHQCEVWAHENGQGKIPGLTRTLVAHEKISLEDGIELNVLDTPGHTFAHLCFIVLEQGEAKAVFTGDTLFNAGVGNCHNGGDPAVLYETISKQFHTLPDHVIVYPGHDYLENNLRFTLDLEGSNGMAQQWLKKAKAADPAINPLLTTIGDEHQLNTFFRLENTEIKTTLKLLDGSEKDIFLALRARRNKW